MSVSALKSLKGRSERLFRAGLLLPVFVLLLAFAIPARAATAGTGVCGWSGCAFPAILQLPAVPGSRGILDFIFGSRKEKEAEQAVKGSKQRIVKQRRIKQPITEQPAAATRTRQKATAVVEPVAKSPEAKTLLVAGDTLAVSLAGALTEITASNPDLVITTSGKGGSGLVRSDFFNWPAELQKRIQAGKNIAAIVVFIGSNDNQSITATSGEKVEPHTPQWNALYDLRVSEIYGAAAKHGIGVIWLGLPPMQKDGYSSAMAGISAVFRENAVRWGGEYIDLWKSFASQDDTYASHGPDISGREVRLRNEDGIHFTSAGNVRIAHMVMTRFEASGGAAAGAVPLASTLPYGPAMPPSALARPVFTVTPAPPVVTGAALAGGVDSISPATVAAIMARRMETGELVTYPSPYP